MSSRLSCLMILIIKRTRCTSFSNLSGSGWNSCSVLILLASFMTYTIAVYTVLDSWWWTEELSETCRVLFLKQIWEISASSWAYCKSLSRCTVTWTSNCTEYGMSLSWLNSQTILDPSGSLRCYDQCRNRDMNTVPSVNKTEELQVQATLLVPVWINHLFI